MRYNIIYILSLGTCDPRDDIVHKYLNESVVRGDGNEGATGVRHYKKWCVGRGDVIHRPFDPIITPLTVKKRELLRLCHFAIWLCKALGVRAATARDYISTVNAWHKRRNLVGFAADADPSIITLCLKGVARTHIPIRATFVRMGVCAHHLSYGMDVVLGKRGECSPQNQNMRAALTCCFAGLLRGCEPCFQDGKEAKFQFLPQRRHLLSTHRGGRAIIIREAKRTSLRDITPFSSTTIEFFAGGEFIDAVAELIALQHIDKADPHAPLFRKPRSNSPIRVSELRDAVKAIAKAAGLDPANFGAHSLRCECMHRSNSIVLQY